MMKQEIVFATGDAEEELESLFFEYGMGLAGNVEEHIIVKDGRQIIAGALVAPIDNSLFHLSVLAVRNGGCNRGIGSHLLQEVIHHPEKYCSGTAQLNDYAYRVTTVARGAAADFYKKNGFIPCTFSELGYPYSEQCKACPDENDCHPVPMMFSYSHSPKSNDITTTVRR